MQQVNSTILEFHNRIDQLEIGGVRNDEAIMAMDCKLESSLEGMKQRLEGSMASLREDMGV